MSIYGIYDRPTIIKRGIINQKKHATILNSKRRIHVSTMLLVKYRIFPYGPILYRRLKYFVNIIFTNEHQVYYNLFVTSVCQAFSKRQLHKTTYFQIKVSCYSFSLISFFVMSIMLTFDFKQLGYYLTKSPLF